MFQIPKIPRVALLKILLNITRSHPGNHHLIGDAQKTQQKAKEIILQTLKYCRNNMKFLFFHSWPLPFCCNLESVHLGIGPHHQHASRPNGHHLRRDSNCTSLASPDVSGWYPPSPDAIVTTRILTSPNEKNLHVSPWQISMSWWNQDFVCWFCHWNPKIFPKIHFKKKSRILSQTVGEGSRASSKMRSVKTKC